MWRPSSYHLTNNHLTTIQYPALSIEHRASSIRNPTLAHFLPSRGSGTAGRHFSSLLTNEHPRKKIYIL